MFSAVKRDDNVCFGTPEMGQADEEKIWKDLIRPVTVLEGGWRDQVRVPARPDEHCTDYTGVVTCTSQAVHVLERGKEWTLIEAYSSADEDSDVRIYAVRFQGYVRTDRLRETEVDQSCGLVIDKRRQQMYVFREGRLFSTLTVSTGIAAEDASSLETPAGEFLIVKRVDAFWSDDYYCASGLCINKSIWIHEVPGILRKDESTGREYLDYDFCERSLGRKSSFGCIRVQRHPTPEGVNGRWLYENLHCSPSTKVIIWDDSGGERGETEAAPDLSDPAAEMRKETT